MEDTHGLSLSTRSAPAAESYNRALASLLGNRADLSAHLKAMLEADPEFALGHCFRGYGAMLMFNRATLPLAADAHRAANEFVPAATPREQLHVRALGQWIAGDVDGALREWEALLGQWPHDALALRLAHFNYFWTGRAAEMRASLERVAPRWSARLAAYPTLLSCLAFALEETGDYAAAEPAGRRAVERDPTEV
jgi:hypothetical protein